MGNVYTSYALSSLLHPRHLCSLLYIDVKVAWQISGWWSYSYCHNHEIRQFHQKPPQNGVNTWPPAEDPATPSYILGQVSPEAAKRTKGQKGEGTELQATGELRFLVQKLGGGTTCDLTRKERKIEVQVSSVVRYTLGLEAGVSKLFRVGGSASSMEGSDINPCLENSSIATPKVPTVSAGSRRSPYAVI